MHSTETMLKLTAEITKTMYISSLNSTLISVFPVASSTWTVLFPQTWAKKSLQSWFFFDVEDEDEDCAVLKLYVIRRPAPST